MSHANLRRQTSSKWSNFSGGSDLEVIPEMSALDHKQGLPDIKRQHLLSECTLGSEYVEEQLIPTPPDGGWGWVIVASSFMLNLIVDGVCYSFGLWLTQFIEYFNASSGQAAMVGSLMAGFYLLIGPVASALTNKYGCRPVSIAGSIITSLAFLLSVFSPNISVLIMTYGVVAGIGFGLMYLPAIVSVGYYFEKKRAFATGIAVCGSGVGTFLFAPFVKYLQSIYDWKGGTMIIAGIVLNGMVCGCLMRPLVAEAEKPKQRMKSLMERMQEAKQARIRTFSDCPDDGSVHIDYGAAEQVEARLKVLASGDANMVNDESDHSATTDDSGFRSRGASGTKEQPAEEIEQTIESALVHSPETQTSSPKSHATTPVGNGQIPEIKLNAREHSEVSMERYTENSTPTKYKFPFSRINQIRRENSYPGHLRRENSYPNSAGIINKNLQLAHVAEGQACISSLHNIPTQSHKVPVNKALLAVQASNPDMMINSTSSLRSFALKRPSYQRITSMHTSKTSLRDPIKEFKRPLYRRDIFFSGSVMNLPEFQSQPNMNAYLTSITSIPLEMAASMYIEPTDEVDGGLLAKCCGPEMRSILGEMLDFSLLKNVYFLLICLSNIFAFVGFYVPFVYTNNRAIELGISPTKAALLLSVIGVANTFSRVLAGWVCDHPKVSALHINNVCLLVSGISTMLVPICSSFVSLVIYCAVFGVTIAAYICLTSVILVDLLGLGKLTNAFGLLMLFRGVSCMVGPPLAGVVYDAANDYSVSFVLAGVFLSLAGAISGCIPLVIMGRRKKTPAAVYEDQEQPYENTVIREEPEPNDVNHQVESTV